MGETKRLVRWPHKRRSTSSQGSLLATNLRHHPQPQSLDPKRCLRPSLLLATRVIPSPQSLAHEEGGEGKGDGCGECVMEVYLK